MQKNIKNLIYHKRNRKYLLFFMCALMIIATISITSVHAYLTAHETRTTVFALDVIEFGQFSLMEHEAVDANRDGSYELGANTVITNDYNIYPGVSIPKDPFVNLQNLNDEAYMFIEVVGTDMEDFQWSIRDEWMLTDLIGINGGFVYVYVGNGDDAVLFDKTSGANFTAYILDGIPENPSGGIVVSDNYDYKSTIDIKFYGYLVQADGFADYEQAYNRLVAL